MSARFAFICASCAWRCAYWRVLAVDIETEPVLAWPGRLLGLVVLVEVVAGLKVVEVECGRIEARG